MVRKANTPSAPQPANLSTGEIKAAIPKLEKRLGELHAFNPEDAVSNKSIPTALRDKIDHTLIEVYGADTIEYNRYRVHSLYDGGVMVMTSRGGPPRHEIIKDYTEGKQKAIAKLETAISMLREQIADVDGTSGTSTPLALDNVDLHPTLQAACGRLYRDSHYADAIGAACKALNNQVQARSGVYDQDNTALMERVFSTKNPVLKFNDLQDTTDQDEQLGLMFLYKGMFLAFRNPRAHKLVDDDPQTAFGIIRTIDFLVKMLDKTKL